MSLSRKIVTAVKNPRQTSTYVLGRTRSVLAKKRNWSKENTKLQKKSYKTYEEYLAHQKSKLDIIMKRGDKLTDYDEKYHVVLRDRLKKEGIVKPGMTVLCLAARLGTEVKSFLDLNAFAVGIDLNPGKDNKYVVYGDFHDLQFADKTVDLMFSNSLDHSFDFSKLIKEIKRVLKADGHLILEIGKGTEEGGSPGYWESAAWSKIDDLVDTFVKAGFNVVKKTEIEYPWDGQFVVLGLASRNK